MNALFIQKELIIIQEACQQRQNNYFRYILIIVQFQIRCFLNKTGHSSRKYTFFIKKVLIFYLFFSRKHDEALIMSNHNKCFMEK